MKAIKVTFIILAISMAVIGVKTTGEMAACSFWMAIWFASGTIFSS